MPSKCSFRVESAEGIERRRPMKDRLAKAVLVAFVLVAGLSGCDDGDCQSVGIGGVFRFCSTPPAPPPAPDAGSGGACLLQYNDALVSGDPCCYRQGGRNVCDQSISCNDRSGAGCCLIYGTENTSGNSRCCL